MFDSPIEKTIIVTAVALWFAHGWYLNDRLALVHTKLDILLDSFNGLRVYLYEIDPQFANECDSTDRFEKHISTQTSKDIFVGLDDLDLRKNKKKAGQRTLDTPFRSNT